MVFSDGTLGAEAVDRHYYLRNCFAPWYCDQSGTLSHIVARLRGDGFRLATAHLGSLCYIFPVYLWCLVGDYFCGEKLRDTEAPPYASSTPSESRHKS
jgi:hypothetical protein